MPLLMPVNPAPIARKLDLQGKEGFKGGARWDLDEVAVRESFFRVRRVRMRRDLWGGDGKGDCGCALRRGLPFVGQSSWGDTMRGGSLPDCSRSRSQVV